MSDAATRVKSLSLWSGEVDPQPVSGGLSNVNFCVEDAGAKYFVRICEDSPYHHVFRDTEARVSRAAHEAGVSPQLVHYETGAMVFDFKDARTYDGGDVIANIDRLVPLVKRCHREVPNHVRGAGPLFWVFHVLRDYAHIMLEGNSRSLPDLARYMSLAEVLEAEIGRIELVFGHNDLLPANFIDDGDRVWLVDWEYGGFNTPLFDLAGMAAMAGFSKDDELRLIEAYYDRPADDAIRRKYSAMRCAAALRETMWAMVSEMHLTPPPGADYVEYTSENQERFEIALQMFEGEFGG
jgi:thiamine kinase-like enzyme